MTVEWLSLAGLAGRPVVKEVIQIIRRKVRNSIRGSLSASVDACEPTSSLYWCPLIFTIVVDSKTPARLNIMGIDYLILNNDIPVQPGYWRKGMKYEAGGYEVKAEAIGIAGNGKAHIKVAFNPVAYGRFPSVSDRWTVAGTVWIDSAYGTIDIPFEQTQVKVRAEGWEDVRQEFNKRFP